MGNHINRPSDFAVSVVQSRSKLCAFRLLFSNRLNLFIKRRQRPCFASFSPVRLILFDLSSLYCRPWVAESPNPKDNSSRRKLSSNVQPKQSTSKRMCQYVPSKSSQRIYVNMALYVLPNLFLKDALA